MIAHAKLFYCQLDLLIFNKLDSSTCSVPSAITFYTLEIFRLEFPCMFVVKLILTDLKNFFTVGSSV